MSFPFDELKDIYTDCKPTRIFVLIVERNAQNGNQRILEWGLRDVSDLATWIALGEQDKNNHQKEAKS